MADRENRFEAAAASRYATGERLFAVLHREGSAAFGNHRE